MGIVIRQSLKGTFVNYIGVLLGAFIQFYCVAAWVDKATIGLSSLVYEAAALLSGFALMGACSVGMRFFPLFKNKDNGNNGFFYYYLLFPLVGIPLVSLLYLVLKSPICAYFYEKSPMFNDYFYYVLPLMMMLTFWTWWEGFSNIYMRIAIPKAIREIGMRLLMVVIYYSYYKQWIGVAGLITFFIIAYGISMVCTGIYASHIGCTSMKHDWRFITPELRGQVGCYSGFLTFSTISSNIMSQLDLWMLAGVSGLIHSGIYRMAVFMAEVVNMPARNITPISNPLAAEAMKNNDIAKANDLYKQVSVHQMLASTVLLLLIWINIDNIYAIMPSKDGISFAIGKWAVLFLGLSKVIYSTLNFGNTLISFSRYYYWTLVVTVVLTLLSVGTNLLFIGGFHFEYWILSIDIPAFGITGAAMATLLASMLSYSYQQYIVQVKLKANPFTWAHLRIVLMVVLLYGINLLIPSLSDISPWLDGAVRSSVYVVVGTILLYTLHISPQIDSYIRQYILRK